MQTEIEFVHHNRREKEAPLMKKYTKLVLSVVAIISTLCFLLYKYRYDRLYNVLAVLEVFGTPDNTSLASSTACAKTVPIQQLNPAWQQVSPSLALYSAYCGNSVNLGCSAVTALGVGREGEEKEGYKCKLW